MDTLAFDVIVIGAGPAGLAAAWRVSQRLPGIRIAVVEKAARIGAHQLSGGLVDPADLADVAKIPSAPLGQPVIRESLHLLTRRSAWPLPQLWPHAGCRILALGPFCRWLAHQAEHHGVELYPGFVAAHLVWEQNRLIGITTGPLGQDPRGRPKPGFQPGITLHAPVTILAEGCRGHLTRNASERLGLDHHRPPQTYGLGFKELWEIPPGNDTQGSILHTVGFPLTSQSHGGGFVYGVAANRLAVGWVVGLDYRDSRLDPFVCFQQWKDHPWIRSRLTRGRPLAFGARTLVEGGWQCLPRLVFDGGMIIGDGAGFLNAARLQGIGNAIRSGLAAADGVVEAFENNDFSSHGLQGYPQRLTQADWFKELHRVRNVRPGFRVGRMLGGLNAAWEKGTRGSVPWTWRWQVADRDRLGASDGLEKVSLSSAAPWILDRSQALALAAVRQRVDQPVHLVLEDPDRFLSDAACRLGHPETRFCPAGVFEVKWPPVVTEPVYRIHASNCLHCKCCDIKEPFGNIRWTPPEGGGGPDYGAM
ncbi:MAG: FAD-binding protein [Magnetococcales bacterium]|nr:4Fe-4S dicluster domain-containing protein [Magnetococcales bacterium]NGZ07057.1 FAD-binding protein [Magnetococcales bacterium]